MTTINYIPANLLVKTKTAEEGHTLLNLVYLYRSQRTCQEGWSMQRRIYMRKVKRWRHMAVDIDEWELWGVPQSSAKASSLRAQAKPPK